MMGPLAAPKLRRRVKSLVDVREGRDPSSQIGLEKDTEPAGLRRTSGGSSAMVSIRPPTLGLAVQAVPTLAMASIVNHDDHVSRCRHAHLFRA